VWQYTPYIKSCQLWTNETQKIHLANYKQTVQLVIFYLYLILYIYAARFDVIENFEKILVFRCK